MHIRFSFLYKQSYFITVQQLDAIAFLYHLAVLYANSAIVIYLVGPNLKIQLETGFGKSFNSL